MSTDTSLDALEIIRIYGLRFKTEHSFRQAVRVTGAFSSHFWMPLVSKKKQPKFSLQIIQGWHITCMI